jgi:choline-glycine betaine transporter
MLISISIDIGIISFGAAEPPLLYLEPPAGEGQTPQLLRNAMLYTCIFIISLIGYVR